MITMKYMLLGCFATSMLIGMDHTIKYHSNACHYAQIEQPYLAKGLFITQIAYPLAVKQCRDNKDRARFNFDNPISSMEWDKINTYTLRIMLRNGKKHEFCLDYLN